MGKSKMFSFVDVTWSPIRVRRCEYDCYRKENGKAGCWAQGLKETKLKKAYDDFFQSVRDSVPTVKFDENAPVFCPGHPSFAGVKCVFVQTMSDLMAPQIPTELIRLVMDIVRHYPGVDFLLMTKNPERYFGLIAGEGDDFFPENVIFGVTVESNRNYPELSKAPRQTDRLRYAWMLSKQLNKRVLISIEPIMEFDFYEFSQAIKLVGPVRVAVGFDNYKNDLPEPSVQKTINLIEEIEKFTDVSRKNLRGYPEP